tara:strand:- start:216 stop:878 length:663 start_codon:yes stop_codon:yes gene_type:complete
MNPAFSKDIDNQRLGDQLETSLNQKNHDVLKDIFLQKSLKKFEKKYLNFQKSYTDTKWSIKTISHDKDNRLLDVKITSKREINDQIYNLNSYQTIKLKTFKNKIKSYEIIYEESILHSQDSPLVIRITSPDQVLTGERYEVNLIIEAPLDNSLIASGMVVIKNKKGENISNDPFGIKPSQSGGIFKYIQAPLEPGFQTIAAIITHPEGIYAFTKKIKVGL